MEIKKPMSIERAEFIGALTELIKKSQLPLFVIEPILSDALKDVHILAQRQLQDDIKQYQELLKTEI